MRRINVIKKIKTVAIYLLIFGFLMWVVDLVRIEYLTLRHGNEFHDIIQAECNIDAGGYYKVLDYKHLKYGRIYCVVKNDKIHYASEMIILDNGDKDIVFNDTVWSTSGSASEVIWPYWWHFIYGGF